MGLPAVLGATFFFCWGVPKLFGRLDRRREDDEELKLDGKFERRFEDEFLLSIAAVADLFSGLPGGPEVDREAGRDVGGLEPVFRTGDVG